MNETSEAEQLALIAERSRLSRALVLGSMAAIGVVVFFACLSVAVQISSTGRDYDRALALLDRVSSSFFPLVGAWLGTLIAFYFAKDNFEQAARSTRALMRQALPEAGLEAKRVRDHLTLLARIDPLERAPEGELLRLNLAGLLQKMALEGRDRVPLLTEDGRGWAILHDSAITRFLASRHDDEALEGATIASMKEDPVLGPWLPHSVAYISPAASLAHAQRRMLEESRKWTPGCSDLFVTRDGTPDAPVIGFLSDRDIFKANWPA